MMTSVWSACVGAGVALSGAAGQPAAAPAASVAYPQPYAAFVGAHVITAEGAEIDKGVVIVKDGKITAVGAEGSVVIPPDATTIDCKGKVIMPGIVDTHSHVGGIGGADGSGPIQPDVRVYDSINVNDSGFRRVVAGGITTLNVMPGSGHLLSGQTTYLKMRMPQGRRPHTIEEWFYFNAQGQPMGGIKMANGTNPLRDPPFSGTRGKSAALVRAQYVKAQEYRDKIVKASEPAKPAADKPADKPGEPMVSTMDVDKLPSRDVGLDALVEVLNGTRIVHHHTHRADDIITVLRLAREFKFRVVLHHVSEAWKVADEIAQAQKEGLVLGCSVILIDAPGGKLEAAEMSFETGAILEKAGVRMAYHTDDWITDSRLFLRSAALGMRAGLSREGAIKAMTISGAEMLDLADRVGSLKVGKDADLVILSGDPFSVYTKIEQTWVEGRKVFDRTDPMDKLFAEGGMNAGSDLRPYLCCVGSGVFAFGGQQWMVGGGDAK